MKYIYWQEEGMCLGYLEEYPDYMTQGVSIEELQSNLKDIYKLHRFSVIKEIDSVKDHSMSIAFGLFSSVVDRSDP
jgi:predicted RNase H-like HicB family nuclease